MSTLLQSIFSSRSMNCHLNGVEGFEEPMDPVASSSMPLVGSPKQVLGKPVE